MGWYGSLGGGQSIKARAPGFLLVFFIYRRGNTGQKVQTRRWLNLRRRSNVRWVGSKPFSALPGYLRLIDVGLTPYADTAFNRASFPLKTLEYLAAGRAVVATPLPANDWLGTDLITVAADPAAFAAEVAARLGTPRSAELVERRRAFARRHSWARRAETMADLLKI